MKVLVLVGNKGDFRKVDAYHQAKDGPAQGPCVCRGEKWRCPSVYNGTTIDVHECKKVKKDEKQKGPATCSADAHCYLTHTFKISEELGQRLTKAVVKEIKKGTKALEAKKKEDEAFEKEYGILFTPNKGEFKVGNNKHAHPEPNEQPVKQGEVPERCTCEPGKPQQWQCSAGSVCKKPVGVWKTCADGHCYAKHPGTCDGCSGSCFPSESAGPCQPTGTRCHSTDYTCAGGLCCQSTSKIHELIKSGRKERYEIGT